ncbi:MAG: ubiquinol-cytochrome c reductase iron-sulfur subunit [Cytophagaceae bacterium]|nr:ubiquinol-cytochrome c reductase iron-sulfur subunit [Gemmatimonadaceae bacterium]
MEGGREDAQRLRRGALDHSATEYRALSSICTHEQCTVTGFSGGVLRCPCHGSRYSTSGAVVQGPATQSLRVFPTAFDAGSGTITATLT